MKLVWRWMRVAGCGCAALALLLAAPESAPGQCLDGGRVRWIIPQDTGGGYDTFMRLLAPFYARRLGAGLACENITEAGGLVGALAIRDAAPDGRALGILNSTALLTRRLAGEAGIPDLGTNYTLLARVDRSCHVWVTGRQSGLRSMEDVFRTAAKRPLVCGLREVGSSGFASFVIGASLLGLDYELVAGYAGSRDALLAALRGDVDLVSYNFESIAEAIEAGDVRPLLQVSERPIADHPALKDVPLLAGREGLAAQRARARGGDAGQAEAESVALAGLVGAGRLLAGPAGLDPKLAACARRALLEALRDPAFQAAAAKSKITLDIAEGADALRDLQAVEPQIEAFRPLVKAAIGKVRK